MFVSKKLRGSFEKSKETLKSFVQDISQVSQDIRLLELILKNYALNSPFYFLFAHELKAVPAEPGEAAKIDQELHVYEFVSWEINEKQKKASYRIVYKKYEVRLLPSHAKWDEQDKSNFVLPKDARLIEKRPLVETSALTRLKIYPYLPTFVEKLADELSKHKTKLDFTKFRLSIDEFERTMKADRESN